MTDASGQQRVSANPGPVGGSGMVHFERERGVTEVRVRRGLAHVTVHFEAGRVAGERLTLLQALAAESVPVFLVKLPPFALSFAVRADVVDTCERLLSARRARYTLLRDLALIGVVAGAMRDLSGVMARIYEALAGAGVSLRQTGDAYNAVLLLVAGDEADEAARSLRAAFALPEQAR